MRNRVLTGAACVALIAALTGCGTTTATTTTITGTTLTIYASVPLAVSGPEGAAARDVFDAEQLALHQAGGKVGRFTVDLAPPLNDATSTGPSAKLIAANARAVIQRPNAIAYIGETDPGASAQSIPITNADELLQVSPYDTMIGLTLATGADPGSPNKYYESFSTYGRTFGRVVPNDTYQAKADLQVMQGLGVKKLFIAQDGTPYGDAIALAVEQNASKYGITASAPARSTTALSQSGDDALFYGGVVGPAAVTEFNGAVSSSPKIKLFAPGGPDASTAVSQLTPAAQSATYLSEPGLTPAELPPAGQTFLADFKAAYGHAPATQAIFGYAAMQVVLGALRGSGINANNRAANLNHFYGAKNISTAIGTLSISKSGDVSVAPYLFDRFKNGALVAYKSLIVSP